MMTCNFKTEHEKQTCLLLILLNTPNCEGEKNENTVKYLQIAHIKAT